MNTDEEEEEKWFANFASPVAPPEPQPLPHHSQAASDSRGGCQLQADCCLLLLRRPLAGLHHSGYKEAHPYGHNHEQDGALNRPQKLLTALKINATNPSSHRPSKGRLTNGGD